ncbi:MAG: hypothetical protein GX921_00595 [Bacteroidales bacterium]|nr:hypothetical protein [Bacteroidales bacterium]
MKKILSISLIFLLAFVITYAGSGINAYSFCCDDCYTFGVEAITTNKCCDIHENECSTEQDSSDNAPSCESSHEHCSIERLDIDIEGISSETNQNQLSIRVLDTLFPTLPYLSKQEIEIKESTGLITQTQKPPNLSKHIYFSLLEILII